jgi:hypothetical protein
LVGALDEGAFGLVIDCILGIVGRRVRLPQRIAKLLRPPPAFLLYYVSHEEFHNGFFDFALRHRADDFVTVGAQVHGFFVSLYILKKGFLIAQIAHILELSPTSFVSLMT